MERATVRSWLVAEGATVEIGAPIVEIESEKIANELQAEISGVLRRIMALEGTDAGVGDPLAIVSTSAESDAEVESFAKELMTAVVSRPAEAEGGPKWQRAKVGGHDLAYLKLGVPRPEALPALLIHGFGGDSTTWQLNAPVLGERRTVLTLDLPGHGASSRDVGAGSFDELVEAASGFLTALELNSVHLVGHSLGAAIAVRLAQQHPGRFASLTLLSPVGMGAAVNPEFIESFTRAEGRKDLKRALEMLFADPSIVTPDLVEKVQQAKRLDGTREALTAIASAVFASDGPFAAYDPASFDSHRTKSLVIWGDKDRIVEFDKWIAPSGDAHLERLSGIGHMPQIEAAERVNQLLEAHLAKWDP